MTANPLWCIKFTVKELWMSVFLLTVCLKSMLASLLLTQGKFNLLCMLDLHVHTFYIVQDT